MSWFSNFACSSQRSSPPISLEALDVLRFNAMEGALSLSRQIYKAESDKKLKTQKNIRKLINEGNKLFSQTSIGGQREPKYEKIKKLNGCKLNDLITKMRTIQYELNQLGFPISKMSVRKTALFQSLQRLHQQFCLFSEKYHNSNANIPPYLKKSLNRFILESSDVFEWICPFESNVYTTFYIDTLSGPIVKELIAFANGFSLRMNEFRIQIPDHSAERLENANAFKEPREESRGLKTEKLLTLGDFGIHLPVMERGNRGNFLNLGEVDISRNQGFFHRPSDVEGIHVEVVPCEERKEAEGENMRQLETKIKEMRIKLWGEEGLKCPDSRSE